MNCLSSNQENVEMKELLKTQLEKKKALLNDDLVNSYIAEKSIELERQEQMVKEQSGDSNDEKYTDDDDDDDGVLALIQFSSPSSFLYQQHQMQNHNNNEVSIGLPSMSQKFNSIPIKYTPRQQFTPFMPNYTTQLQQEQPEKKQFSFPQNSNPQVVLPSQVLPSIKSEFQKETLLPGVNTMQNPLTFVPNWLESERTKYLNAKVPKKTDVMIETN